MNVPIPLILLSGLGADESVFAPQMLAFPQIQVPRWPIPNRSESLAGYAQRLADLVRPQLRDSRCIIGGASFGGVVALEMAKYLNPLAVILIGSVREPRELPLHIKVFRPIRALAWILPVGLAKRCALPFTTLFARKVAPLLAGLARQFRNADNAVLRWSIYQLLAWCKPPSVHCPIFQIHGDHDLVLPIDRTHPDTKVIGGGHLISLTHSVEVNAFIRSCLESVSTSPNATAVYP